MSTLVLKSNPKSPVSEAYRTLRTNIQFSSFDKNLQSILVTSSMPSEGKSTTAGNLALTLAETGKRVILIDCDLRKPSIHKKFKISNILGLSNLLVDNLDLEKVVQKFDENLFILTSGTIPPNPVEMLSSQKMRNFLDEMKKEFDYIILDTPPVNVVTDSQVLSTMSDGVLLVVSSGEAERTGVERAKDLLLKVRANIIGVILNKIDTKSKRNYSYNYYYGDDRRGKRK